MALLVTAARSYRTRAVADGPRAAERNGRDERRPDRPSLGPRQAGADGGRPQV